MPIQEFLFSILAGAPYDIAKYLLQNSIHHDDRVLKSINRCVDRAEERFYEKYGNKYGTQHSSFLSYQINRDRIIESFYYDSTPLTPDKLVPEGDEGVPRADLPALTFLINSLRDEVRSDWLLNKIVFEKRSFAELLERTDPDAWMEPIAESGPAFSRMSIANTWPTKNNALSCGKIYRADLMDQEGKSIVSNVCDSIRRSLDRSYLILGNSGSGKTSLCLDIYDALVIDESIKVFLINLSPSKHTNESKLLTAIANSLGRADITLQELSSFSKRYNVTLLLDGLDEAIWCIDDENEFHSVLSELDRIAQFTRLVVTSRIHRLLSPDGASLLLSEKFVTLAVQPMNKSSIISHYRRKRDMSVYKLLSREPNLVEMATSPIIHAIITSIPHHLESDSYHNRSQLYHTITMAWLDRDKGRRSIMSVKAAYDFMSEIAFDCFARKKPVISRSRICHLLDNLCEQAAHELSRATEDIASCSLLTPTQGGANYQFIHNSFLEYFLSTSASSRMCAGALDDDSAAILYKMPETIGFMREHLSEYDPKAFIELLTSRTGTNRTLLIVVSRNILESRAIPLDLILKILHDPFLEVASKLELIYAVYRRGTPDQKTAMADILISDQSGYISTGKAQYSTSKVMLDWATSRIREPQYFRGREFLYFYPILLSGEEEDIALVRPFTQSTDSLIRKQAEYVLSEFSSRPHKVTW